MAAEAGRTLALWWKGASSGTRIPCREKSIALSSEGIDITADDNAGWRTLLAEASELQVNISLSGVTKSDILRAAWFTGDSERTQLVELVYEDTAEIAGQFVMTSYNETANHTDAVSFDCELQSTGAVTYTPAP